MAISYCSLAQAKATHKVENTTGEFSNYFAAVHDRVTRRIDTLTHGLVFAPRIETRYFDAFMPSYRNSVLYTNYPLLSITSVVLDGTTTLDAGDYELASYDGIPALSVYRVNSWSFTGTTRRRAIAITGIWGYRSYYATEGWKQVTTIAANIADTTTTSVTTTSAAQLDIGDMIQINDEYMSVVSKASNVLTVERGIRGSTAATHTSGDAIERWQVEPDIADAASLMVSYAYARRGNFQQVEFSAGGAVAVTFPDDQPRSVQNILNRYRLGYTRVV